MDTTEILISWFIVGNPNPMDAITIRIIIITILIAREWSKTDHRAVQIQSRSGNVHLSASQYAASCSSSCISTHTTRNVVRSAISAGSIATTNDALDTRWALCMSMTPPLPLSSRPSSASDASSTCKTCVVPPGPQSTSLFILGTWWLSGLQCNGLGFQDWAAIFAQRLNAMSYSWFQTGHKKIRNLASFIGPVSLITAWSCQWLTHSVLLRLNWETIAVENVNENLLALLLLLPMLVSTEWLATVWWQLCNSLATAFHSLDTVFSLVKTQS